MAKRGTTMRCGRRLVIGIVSGLLVTGAAACGSGDSGDGGPALPPPARQAAHSKQPASAKPAPPPLGVVPSITKRGQHIPMPLDRYMLSANDMKLIDKAAGLKARDCMVALGFEDWKPEMGGGDRPDAYQRFEPLDYLDPAIVARSGYPQTLVNKDAGKAVPPPSRDAFLAFDGAEKRTATGAVVPPGGCDGQAQRQVKGGETELPADPRLLVPLSQQYALRDARMTKLFATWKTCMARGGLHYDGPTSAPNDRRWGRRTAPAPAGAAERHVAAADARCQNAIHLVGVYKALEIGYQRELVTTNKAALTAAKAITDRWLASARAITGKK